MTVAKASTLACDSWQACFKLNKGQELERTGGRATLLGEAAWFSPAKGRGCVCATLFLGPEVPRALGCFPGAMTGWVPGS